MGALTSNRKRGEDYFNLNYKLPILNSPAFDHRIDTHVSKKPKISPSMHQSPDRPVPSKSTASRIFQYPEVVTAIRREIHAPCRNSKFGFARNSRRSTAGLCLSEVRPDVMGNVLVSHYQKTRINALGVLRYGTKAKDVIDVDEAADKDDASEDSSIEEVAVVEDGREGESDVSDEMFRKKEGLPTNFPGMTAKVCSHPSSSSVASDLTNANLKVDIAGKALDSISLDRELKVLDEPVHKKLFDFAGGRDEKLNRLCFEIEFYEKRRAAFQMVRPRPQLPKKSEEDVLGELFKPLTEDEEAVVVDAFRSNRRKILVNHENSGIEITGEEMQCLRPGAWLNDEVINLYLELLKEREKREPKKFLKCHFFSTFFYKKLIGGKSGYDYKSVKRWTTHKKLGYSLFDCDKVFVPIHKEIHWCLAVINKKEQKFQYLDSLGGVDKRVLNMLGRYFVDEVKDKSGKDIDLSSWKQEFVEDLPEQENGYDCGVFMIKYVDFYSRGIGLCFNQEHMPYFRLRTAKEILRLKAE